MVASAELSAVRITYGASNWSSVLGNNKVSYLNSNSGILSPTSISAFSTLTVIGTGFTSTSRSFTAAGLNIALPACLAKILVLPMPTASSLPSTFTMATLEFSLTYVMGSFDVEVALSASSVVTP